MVSFACVRSVKALRLTVLGVALAAMQGCGMIYKTTGDVLVSFGRSEMVPYMMSDNDSRIACAAGEAQTPLLMSFGRVGAHPDKLAVLLYVTAASCTDALAAEEELRYLRAVKQGNVAEAQEPERRGMPETEIRLRPAGMADRQPWRRPGAGQ